MASTPESNSPSSWHCTAKHTARASQLGCIVHRTILFIDPDVAGNKLAALVLRPDGWTVHAVTTTAAAFETLDTLVPALIVTELEHRDMDGLRFIEALRAAPSTRHTPIVAVTSVSAPETEQRARAAGVVDYIHKPINVMTFASRLTEALGARP